ncbi:MAG: hypothetical protein ACLVJK_05730 [Alistipes putredinis]
MAALLRRAEFPRDLIVSEEFTTYSDHATVTSGFGGKLAFDLTEIDPSAPAEAVRVPERFELTPGLVEVADGLAGKWGALLLFADDAVEQKPDLAAFLARNPCRGIRYAVLFDGHARTMRPDELLWLAAANTDPRRDVECRDGGCAWMPGASGPELRATFALSNVVTSLPEVVRKVDERWAEYGLGERPESPPTVTGVVVVRQSCVVEDGRTFPDAWSAGRSWCFSCWRECSLPGCSRPNGGRARYPPTGWRQRWKRRLRRTP